jgi:hypothetical protein
VTHYLSWLKTWCEEAAPVGAPCLISSGFSHWLSLPAPSSLDGESGVRMPSLRTLQRSDELALCLSHEGSSGPPGQPWLWRNRLQYIPHCPSYHGRAGRPAKSTGLGWDPVCKAEGVGRRGQWMNPFPCFCRMQRAVYSRRMKPSRLLKEKPIK